MLCDRDEKAPIRTEAIFAPAAPELESGDMDLEDFPMTQQTDHGLQVVEEGLLFERILNKDEAASLFSIFAPFPLSLKIS